jgi:hypothetical protein
MKSMWLEQRDGGERKSMRKLEEWQEQDQATSSNLPRDEELLETVASPGLSFNAIPWTLGGRGGQERKPVVRRWRC